MEEFAYNICPKTGSFNYFSRELSACVYVIMARLEVNWAKIIFDNLVREHTTYVPYGSYLTHTFKKFKIDVASETNVVKTFEPFDGYVLLRM